MFRWASQAGTNSVGSHFKGGSLYKPKPKPKSKGDEDLLLDQSNS